MHRRLTTSTTAFLASILALAVGAVLVTTGCGSDDEDAATTTVTEQVQGPTGATGPTGPSGPSPTVEGATRAVYQHYGALNRSRFATAWGDFSPQLKAELGPYRKFVNGYAFTEGTYLQEAQARRLGSATFEVTVAFDADYVDACGDSGRQRYGGTWVVDLALDDPVLAEADIEFLGGDDPVQKVSTCPAPPSRLPAPPDVAQNYGPDYPGAYLPPQESGGFCATHDCIPNFDNGKGYVVQCEDGTWSQSGGIQGACSWHGGVR